MLAQDVGRLRLSPSISSGGTREPRWVSDERRRERTAYGTVFHPSFTSPFFPRSYVTRLVTLTSFLGADWVEWEEATRIEVKRAEFQPFVDSVLLTLSPLASFACHSLRSLGGAGPEDGSERGWMACSRAERTENRSERLTHGINVSPLVVMFRPPCVVPSVSTSSGLFTHIILLLPTSSPPPVACRSLRHEKRRWCEGEDVKRQGGNDKEPTKPHGNNRWTQIILGSPLSLWPYRSLAAYASHSLTSLSIPAVCLSRCRHTLSIPFRRVQRPRPRRPQGPAYAGRTGRGTEAEWAYVTRRERG